MPEAKAHLFKLPSLLDDVYVANVTNEGSGNVADATLREFASGQKLFGRYTLTNATGRFVYVGLAKKF